MIARTARRPGFTLLELLLASAIAAFLLAGLYTALDLVLKRADINRDQIAASDLSRSIVNRLTADLTASAGLLPPMSNTTSAASGSSTTSSGATTTGSGSGTGSSTTTTTSTTAVDTSTDIPFPCGVVGTDKQVTIFCTRVPTALTDPDVIANPDPNQLSPGDVRRVTYYLNNGLCRQERPWVTADGVRNSADPDMSTAETDVIAPEVTDATFEYFGGGTWNNEWDGTVTGSDGVTLQGPPRAIRVTLQLTYPLPTGGTKQKTVVHVVPLRAAVGSYVDETTTTTTTSTTGGS